MFVFRRNDMASGADIAEAGNVRNIENVSTIGIQNVEITNYLAIYFLQKFEFRVTQSSHAIHPDLVSSPKS